MHRRTPRLRIHRVGVVERAFKPRDEREGFLLFRFGRADGRHLSGANFAQHFFPEVGIAGDAIKFNAFEYDASGFGFERMRVCAPTQTVPSTLTIRPSKIARREISDMAPIIVHLLVHIFPSFW